MRGQTIFIPLTALRFSKKSGSGVCPHRIEELRSKIENGENIEPIRVNMISDGIYTIKDGRRRVQAYIAAGFSEILVFVENLFETIKRLARNIFRILPGSLGTFLFFDIMLFFKQ
ncbi:MAG: ParB/Srx family N-terminal domain-containing protein [Patescibacteria group bacterium]